MKNFIFVFLMLILGCGQEKAGVNNAQGDTPVKYVICGVGETDCFVAGRFNNLDGCQHHKEWSDMLCDSLSTPGKMICTKNTHSTIAVSYCTL